MQMVSTFSMTIISILSALLSGMWVWADKWSDVRLSINDFYMAFLMTGWMFLLQGAFMKQINYLVIGVIVVIFTLIAIRIQLFVSQQQYLLGMIPHHSMAVFLSKMQISKAGNNNKILNGLPYSIIKGQDNEIKLMKHLLNMKTGFIL
jgi:hypothetical protein